MSCTNTCESNQIKYQGDGTQVLFTFPFTYIDQDDVYVSIYNYVTRRWVDAKDPSWLGVYEWDFANATTIEFTTAPEEPVDIDLQEFNIKISRCTSIDPLAATFYPGSAIRAQDLNDNFEQLQLAIQEGRCQVPDWLFDYLDLQYWNKFEDVIIEEQQTSGAVVTDELIDDEHILTAAASAARHDNYVLDNRPPSIPLEQEGKIWNDTDDLQDYFWDPTGNVWVSFTKTGPPGPQGDFGPPGHVIIADNPPLLYPAIGDDVARPLESGDLWYDSLHVLLYVYYLDDNGPGQWVAVSKTGPVGPPGPPGQDSTGEVEEAPNDGQIYGRQNESWTSIPDDLISDAPIDGVIYGRQNGQWEEVEAPLTFTIPLVKDNSNDVAFVWSSMNQLP